MKSIWKVYYLCNIFVTVELFRNKLHLDEKSLWFPRRLSFNSNFYSSKKSSSRANYVAGVVLSSQDGAVTSRSLRSRFRSRLKGAGLQSARCKAHRSPGAGEGLGKHHRPRSRASVLDSGAREARRSPNALLPAPSLPPSALKSASGSVRGARLGPSPHPGQHHLARRCQTRGLHDPTFRTKSTDRPPSFAGIPFLAVLSCLIFSRDTALPALPKSRQGGPGPARGSRKVTSARD